MKTFIRNTDKYILYIALVFGLMFLVKTLLNNEKRNGQYYECR